MSVTKPPNVDIVLRDRLWVFISYPLNIDLKIFSLWTQGLSVEEIYSDSTIVDYYGTGNKNVLIRHIQDHIRTFSEMKKFFNRPNEFENQHIFCVDPYTLSRVFEEYYTFDQMFLRELVGKKLNDKLKDSVFDICEKLKIKRASGLRQFDNFKRVYKRVSKSTDKFEDIVERICTEFMITKDMAEDYIRMIYLNYNQFDVKKRLAHLQFGDFMKLADTFLRNWIIKVPDYFHRKKGQDKDEAPRIWTAHSKIFARLHMIKTLMLANKEDLPNYHQRCVVLLEDTNEELWDFGKNKLPQVLKSMLSIAGSLSQPKEYKKIFGDIVEKIFDPMSKYGLKKSDVQTLFDALAEAFSKSIYDSATFHHTSRSKINEIWQTYLKVIRESIVFVFYDNV